MAIVTQQKADDSKGSLFLEVESLLAQIKKYNKQLDEIQEKKDALVVVWRAKRLLLEENK